MDPTDLFYSFNYRTSFNAVIKILRKIGGFDEIL